MGIPVKTMVLQKEMTCDGVPVLTYKIEYPAFEPGLYQLCAAMINGCYRTKALEYQAYLEQGLFSRAVEQLKAFPTGEGAFPIYESLVTYHVTYNGDCIISLYSDTHEYSGGAHGTTFRTSQTWNLQKCRRLQLGELFACGTDYQALILDKAEAEIGKESEIYFENAAELLLETFESSRFYCTPEGIVVYYLPYEIAPYSSGIREFCIPYGNGIYDPCQMCMTI